MIKSLFKMSIFCKLEFTISSPSVMMMPERGSKGSG